MSLKLRNVVLNLRIILSFVLMRNVGSIIYDVAQKYDLLEVSDIRKCEKLHLKVKKAELDGIFLSNCRTLHVFPKF